LRQVSASYDFILSRIRNCFELPELVVQGSDLAIGDRKVYGNSQRRGRRALLHHGTILYDFDHGLMDRFLRLPVRRPAYRRNRDHLAFVTNLPLTKDRIEIALQRAWRLL
jgi:lipoate-protein ligase A